MVAEHPTTVESPELSFGEGKTYFEVGNELGIEEDAAKRIIRKILSDNPELRHDPKFFRLVAHPWTGARQVRILPPLVELARDKMAEIRTKRGLINQRTGRPKDHLKKQRPADPAHLPSLTYPFFDLSARKDQKKASKISRRDAPIIETARQMVEDFFVSLAQIGKPENPDYTKITAAVSSLLARAVHVTMLDMKRHDPKKYALIHASAAVDQQELLKKELLAILSPIQEALSFTVQTLNLDLQTTKDVSLLNRVISKMPARERTGLAEELNKRHKNIIKLLNNDRQTAREVVKTQPSLWAQNPETMRTKLNNIAALLGESPETPTMAREVVKTQPRLWTQNPETMRTNLNNIAALLGESPEAPTMAREVVKTQPSLWGQNPETVRGKFNALFVNVSDKCKNKNMTVKDLVVSYPEILWFSISKIPAVAKQTIEGDPRGIEYVRFRLQMRQLPTVRRELDYNRDIGPSNDDEKEPFLESLDIEKFWKKIAENLEPEELTRLRQALDDKQPIPEDLLLKLATISGLKEFL